MSGAPSQPKTSLTGVWHGLYSYPRDLQPIYFVATLIDHGRAFSGATHEAERGEDGFPLTLFAMVDGGRIGQEIHFTKTYDGSGGWSHTVTYEGRLDEPGLEIEGTWSIPPSEHGPGASGRFLMIRSSGASEAVARQQFAKV
jgi:hypothetical protein